MFYECQYCNWCGEEPNQAAFPDTEEGRQAYERDIEAFRNDQENHSCIGPK